MIDYKQLWKVRKIQIIVINAIFAVLGIVSAVMDSNLLEGIYLWFFGSWIVEAMVATFATNGGRAATIGKDILASIFSGTFAAWSGGATLWVIYFTFAMVKACFGMLALFAILVFQFFAFPITSIYYYIQSKKQC